VGLFYADSSALVKLVRDEPETVALRTYLAGADIISSELVLTEVPRAVRRAASHDRLLSIDSLLQRTVELVEALALIPIDRPVLAAAGAISEPAVRDLDAIHVAAAAYVSPIDAFVTYDERQAAAARLVGLRTTAPGS
jgi:predicted nucleic acid-binding protein